MTDYSNACIYKIICKDESITDMYIGSTINFKSRESVHKHHCNNPNSKKYNCKIYKFIRENSGWQEWQMIKICDVKCLDGYDLRKAEGSYQRELKPTLNYEIAGRSKEEGCKAYRIKNKDKINADMKPYRIKNKDKIKKYMKAYRIKNKDRINKVKRENYAKKKLLKT